MLLHITLQKLMESIYTKTRIKGQGSRELVDRLKKERMAIYDILRVWLSRTRLLSAEDHDCNS